MAARSGVEAELKGPKFYYDLRYPVIIPEMVRGETPDSSASCR